MPTANVVILAGQSNAVGVGYTRYLPLHFAEDKVQEYKNGYPNVQIYYYSHDQKSDGFVPVKTGCSEKNKDTFGPDLGIADYFCGKHPNDKLFILKCAVGGTNLWFDWCSPSRGDGYDPDAGTHYVEEVGLWQSKKPRGAGWLYNQFVQTVTEGLEQIKAQGYTPQIKGFCWMQGESDAVSERCEAYGHNYACLMQDVWQTFGTYMQGCIFADAAIGKRWECDEQINAFKKQYAESHPNCKFVDTVAAGLTVHNEPPEKPDTAHYDSNCVIQLGHLFAEAIEL